MRGTEDRNKADKQWLFKWFFKLENTGPEKKLGKIQMNVNMEEIFNNYIKPKTIILSYAKPMQDYPINAHRAKTIPEKRSAFWTNQMK